MIARKMHRKLQSRPMEPVTIPERETKSELLWGSLDQLLHPTAVVLGLRDLLVCNEIDNGIKTIHDRTQHE